MHAGELTLDLDAAVSRARDRAPGAIAARGAIAQAEATQHGAAVRFTQNPELEAGGGPRIGTPRATEVMVRISQQLEPTRRSARVGLAEASLRHAQATSDDQLRQLAFEVTLVFYEALHADLGIELTRRSQAIAVRAADAAERRRKAGDITDLDVDLAKAALGRARAASATAQSARADAIGRLAVLIGASPEDVIALRGELRPAPVALDLLRAAVPSRADVRALETEARLAAAEGGVARANGRPDLGLWLGFERDSGQSVFLAGLSLTLPLWNRQQGGKAAAVAREQRATAERGAVVSAASRRVVDAFESYVRAREAIEIFEREVLSALDDGERLLTRSVETGQIAVDSYLVARQEILNGRREYLDRMLALAKAASTARFVAGVTR